MLSALAAVTGRIRPATLASSVAYRNPAHLAQIAAGVDQLSGGRMTLGIGAGWFEGEYRRYGWELLLINSDYRNDMATPELFASEIMPDFA